MSREGRRVARLLRLLCRLYYGKSGLGKRFGQYYHRALEAYKSEQDHLCKIVALREATILADIIGIRDRNWLAGLAREEVKKLLADKKGCEDCYDPQECFLIYTLCNSRGVRKKLKLIATRHNVYADVAKYFIHGLMPNYCKEVFDYIYSPV